MSTKFKTIITTAGAAKLAAATVPGGKKVNLTVMAVGDGGGALPEPDVGQVKLINEVWRHTLNKISQDNKNKNYIVAELVIPPEVGGFWMRELGLYDDAGTLIAVANMAESYKPELNEGSGRAQTCRMVIIVSSIASIELSIDATTVMATQDYVDDKLAEHALSRNHPDATLKEKGFVQLSSATDSTSEALAATPKAVRAAYDLASGKYTAQDASTAQKGLVQLSSATDSVSEALGATPKAVKAAYDLASGKYTAQDASTVQKGLVKLSSATDSTSELLAATPKAVKEANDNADKRLAKEQNGRDIPEKDVFVRNIGAARAFSGTVSIGGGGNWTTAEFIVWLESQRAFNHPYWMCKGSWSYDNNRLITDTGCGDIQLAGAVVEVMGGRDSMTIRVTTAPAGSGVISALFTYLNHGEDYSPGWRRDLKRSGDEMTGKLTLPQTSSFGVNADNALGGNSIVIGDTDTGIKQNGEGILDIYSNGHPIMRVTPDAVQVLGWTDSWISTRDQPCFANYAPVGKDGAEAIVRQEHQDRHFILGGLGGHQFGIYMINKSRTANGTDGQAYMDDSGNWVCGGQIHSGNGTSRMGTDGNINGPVWGNGWLNDWLSNAFASRDNNINTRATWDWVSQTFVSDFRLGSRQQMASTGSNEAPSGFVSTGGYVYGSWDNSADGWYIRPIQKLINGTWYNVVSI